MFPNNELKMSDRELSQEKYQEAVHQIFSFYPKPVSIKVGLSQESHIFMIKYFITF
jgi:hypothetical protein